MEEKKIIQRQFLPEVSLSILVVVVNEGLNPINPSDKTPPPHSLTNVTMLFLSIVFSLSLVILTN